MFALAFASVSIAVGATAVFQVPMKATLLVPTATTPLSADLPTTRPLECGEYLPQGQSAPQCGGACGFGQICQTGTQPFGRACICAPDPALPTTPPALCGSYAPAGAEFPSCGGTCPFGQVCQKGQPFGGNLCTCGADPALPTTPPVNCGPFQNGNSPAYQCGGACPAGATCKIGQPFGGDCLCVSTANGSSTSLPRMGN